MGTGTLEVYGPTEDLLLVATGRAAGLDCLTGPGLAVLADRFRSGEQLPGDRRGRP